MKEVKQLNEKNIEQIIELRIDLQNYDKKYFKESENVINEEELKENTKMYLKNNLNKNLFLFGCYEDCILISVCGFYLERHFPTYRNENGQTAHVCNVYTRPEYRRKGYQRKVFEYCIDYAKKNKIRKFELDSKNEIAINFYKEYGFKKVDNTYGVSL